MAVPLLNTALPKLSELLKTTFPVPPGVKLISAFELEPIILSLKVKLSIVLVPVAVIFPVTANVEPLKLKLLSAVIADVPVPVSTALSVKLDAPVPPSATAKSVIPVIVPLVIVTAPVISTASAKVIFEESDESSVVPFTLNALYNTSPVPLGWIEISAFEPLDVIEFVIMEPVVIPPDIVTAPLNVPVVAVNAATSNAPAVTVIPPDYLHLWQLLFQV